MNTDIEIHEINGVPVTFEWKDGKCYWRFTLKNNNYGTYSPGDSLYQLLQLTATIDEAKKAPTESQTNNGEATE